MIEDRTADLTLRMERAPKKSPPRNIVYAAWMGKDCLWVGMSRVGLNRPFVNYRLKAFLGEVTHIDYWYCKDANEALAREVYLRSMFFPILDRSGYYYDRGAKKLIWSDTKFRAQMCLRRIQGTSLLYDDAHLPIV